MHTWSEKELEVYEYWQIRDATDKVVMERQFEKGIEQGIEKGIEKVALNMKLAGIEFDIIMLATGLTRDDIAGLKP
jgi:predicted transposase/invertase (TIGR01784 family)